MEDFIDAEDMLDMLFENKVNLLVYLPVALLQRIVNFIEDPKDLLNIHYVASRLLKVMQDELTWKKLCFKHKFCFGHDSRDWKVYFFSCMALRNVINGIDYRATKCNRFLGGNEKYITQIVRLADEGGTSLEAVRDDVATALPDPNFIGEILYSHLCKDTLLVADRRNIKLIDLEDSKYYDHIITIYNIDTITYDATSKQVFGGMEDGSIRSWRSSRAKVMVGDADPRYHTIDRPHITMKGHTGSVTALLVSVDSTDANQRLVSGGLDANIVIWKKVYANGISYRKEHLLEGHIYSIVNLFSSQNRLVSTDLHSIKIWDLLTGECLHTFFTATTPTPGTTEENPFPTTSSVVVSVSCGFVACVSPDNTRVWCVLTGECTSQFSYDEHKVYGALLDRCFLFTFTSDVVVSVWNIVSRKCIKAWRLDKESSIFPILRDARYNLQLISSGKSAKLIVSSVTRPLDGPHYFEFRVAPPRRLGFGKRKRENLIP